MVWNQETKNYIITMISTLRKKYNIKECLSGSDYKKENLLKIYNDLISLDDYYQNTI